MKKLNEKQLIIARKEFSSFLAVGVKGFPKLKLKTPIEFFKKKMNSSYEGIDCVGYNPAFKELTATISVKKTAGYAGSLCRNGSFEYVRFYLDYQDGNGWKDMGYTALNVHDIPTQKDCDGKNKKPISYVIRLKINPKQKNCSTANLPKVKAVLSWNSIPTANDPNLTIGTYVWGDVKEEQIQISPFKFIFPDFPLDDIGDIFENALMNPTISLSNIASASVGGIAAIKKAKASIANSKVDFQNLADLYKGKVEPHRFGFKLLKEAKNTPNSKVLSNITNLFDSKKISLVDSLVKLNKENCNKRYEELFCVGADYNQEALIGTLKVKQSSGYSGGLCSNGSKEYVSFWIQEDGSCDWKHAGTTFVKVHDINPIPADGLSYSVVLPYDFSKYKRKCSKPKVLKVRAILSWNTPPVGMNCSNWGNVVESYIQIKPKVVSSGSLPKLIIVGGVSTDNIDNSTGLTLPGAKLEFNLKDTFTGSPFGGIIVVTGKSAPFAGQKYKVKITNLITGGSHYLNNNLQLLGYNNGTGSVTHKVENPIGDVYTYREYEDNNLSVLARFSPGNDDKILVTIEHLNGDSNSQVIQMDNTFPAVTLSIDDDGDCTHYSKGDTIEGEFTVNDIYLNNYAVTTDVGVYSAIIDASHNLTQSGTVNGAGKFEVATFANKNCGRIHLRATQKTIWNSVVTGTHRDVDKIVCLS